MKIYGVNRHEFHPDYGHAVPADCIERDIRLCKANNITSIRNSHYPKIRATRLPAYDNSTDTTASLAKASRAETVTSVSKRALR